MRDSNIIMSDTDTDTDPNPIVRRAEEVTYESVELTDGLSMGMLLGDAQDTPHFDMRRFILDPGQKIPEHTNTVEHEQYVLEGCYEVGIGTENFTVYPGDALLIPSGVTHWYRNESSERGSFLCVVPKGDDEIELSDQS